MPGCDVIGCVRRPIARGWCSQHYESWRRHGDPLAAKPLERTPSTVEEAFSATAPIGLDPADCWEWPGSIMLSGGYGSFRFRRRAYRAHRVSWEIANARRIPEGMHVLHSCDNPPCVNPAHLRVGTNAENMRDVAERKRQWGERNGFHKLTAEEVDQIRSAHVAGVRNSDQARAYRVHPSTISLIVNHKNWRPA